jgi:hypothetical protein
MNPTPLPALQSGQPTAWEEAIYAFLVEKRSRAGTSRSGPSVRRRTSGSRSAGRQTADGVPTADALRLIVSGPKRHGSGSRPWGIRPEAGVIVDGPARAGGSWVGFAGLRAVSFRQPTEPGLSVASTRDSPAPRNASMIKRTRSNDLTIEGSRAPETSGQKRRQRLEPASGRRTSCCATGRVHRRPPASTPGGRLALEAMSGILVQGAEPVQGRQPGADGPFGTISTRTSVSWRGLRPTRSRCLGPLTELNRTLGARRGPEAEVPSEPGVSRSSCRLSEQS